MSDALEFEQPVNYDALRRAVAVAQWEIGSGLWAHKILSAYFDPNDEGAAEAIDELEQLS
jgi:hypothetical protein